MKYPISEYEETEFYPPDDENIADIKEYLECSIKISASSLIPNLSKAARNFKGDKP